MNRIKNYLGTSMSSVHACWFFTASHMLLALITWDGAWLIPVPVWLLASFFAWRLAMTSKELATMVAINKIQKALLSIYLPVSVVKGNVVSEPEAEAAPTDPTPGRIDH